ncbi:MAG TPA: serine/threonine-protein kinase, partial [Tepidisphaeraceae bacterium]|nr:serine/threonine-protein kinase [Tepidisphaeraceae bacterium]
MTPERWNIIKELFLEAQELPREQRREFLDARCAQDEPLRHEVEDLLSQTSFELPESSPASSDMTGSLSPAPDFPAWTDVAPPEPEIPKTIGPYQITRALGEGGMGVVYLAERFDPIRQTVAIKLIRPGLDSRAVLSRFQAERRTLAMMNHPNIARVLDAGITADRRPYFVMEYVPGEPITRFCDRHQLSTRARLELFVQACAAVAHAHQKAVLHRDLKPSNLLVTMQDDKPLLKVIDFGVAKATGESRQGQETFFTEHGMLVGTPAYMSPEQADPATSADVDTRSDVYSLGVVLYELLAGALPFEPSALKAAAVAEMLRVIREEEPPRPSNRLKTMDGARGTEVARLRHVARAALESELRRELEWIPLKAMRKEAGQRYRSAGELADDIGHYLAGTPLIAGPESVGYRVRKLLRRNRAKVATAAAFLLLLVAAVIVSTVGFVRASRHAAEIARQKSEVERSRAVAITERDTARAVTDFLTADVLAGAKPANIG